MPHSEPTNDVEPQNLDREHLRLPFTLSCKPVSSFKIGVEHERFGVSKSLQPLQYDADDGILGIFRQFETKYGWEAVRESEGAPVTSLHRGEASLTLEPAAQFEFSGSPCADLHKLAKERSNHADELRTISAELGISWIASGFHPFARHEQLPWVPKHRYGIMREYLPTQGADAIEMMRRTACVQANFDYESIDDALRKLRVGLRISPIVSAMFANGPFVEGRPYGGRSRRVQIWLAVDPSRQGLLPQMWSPTATLDDYIDWALDAPMFMFLRGGKVMRNTGQSFRAFVRDGFEGQRPTQQDWVTHLNTLFPEVRLKQFIEARGADSVPDKVAIALPALWVGIFYDAKSLDEAEAMTEDWTVEGMTELRKHLDRDGLTAEFRGKKVCAYAQRLVGIAKEGLERRAVIDEEGKTEAVYLDAIERLVAKGMCPADEVLQALGDDRSIEGIVRVMSAAAG